MLANDFQFITSFSMIKIQVGDYFIRKLVFLMILGPLFPRNETWSIGTEISGTVQWNHIEAPGISRDGLIGKYMILLYIGTVLRGQSRYRSYIGTLPVRLYHILLIPRLLE